MSVITTVTSPHTAMPNNDSPVDDPASGKSDTPKTEVTENMDTSAQETVKETEPPRRPSRIRYTAACFNYDGQNFSHSQDEPFPSQVPQHDETAKPIIEVITSMRVALKSDSKQANEKNDQNFKGKKETMDDKVIRGIDSSRIIIHSPYLSELIRDTVDYYPGQNLTGETILIHEPYGVLLHYWEKLNQTHSSSEESFESKESDRKIQLEHLDEEDNLPERWEVKIWFLSMHWSYGTLIPASHTIDIPKFEGEKKVGQLDVYPEQYFEGDRKKDFEIRGDQICDMLWNGHKYANYDGELMSNKKMKYKGQIILSAFGDQAIQFEEDKWAFDMDPEPVDKARPANGSSEVLQPLWLDPTKDSRDSLTWIVSAHVGNIQDLAQEEVPEAIVSSEKLKIIKALAERQMSPKPWSADYIKNKGEGVVILLHESIAMRKRQPLISLSTSDLRNRTTTLEEELTRWFKMADKWRAILLIDECDLFLERREKKDFARNAIVSAFLGKIEYFGGLLFLTTNRVGHIDDAFMSRVHAVIGFDPLDGTRREKIWDSLLTKLNRERKGVIRISNGAKKFLKTPEVLEYTDWNGREIRNAFQTAIALAEYEAKNASDYDQTQEIIVEAEHFKDVMEMNKSFRSYLDSIKDRNEGERAHSAAWRNDSWNAEEKGN
ncbi:hypothetical protein CSPX01_12426 [Colletotrichum filicis]|nr:hypothetical protein CSPX01_12426 [Colletotrichum filicis]